MQQYQSRLEQLNTKAINQGYNSIKEEYDDDELMDELNLRKPNKAKGSLNPEIKEYINLIFEESS